MRVNFLKITSITIASLTSFGASQVSAQTKSGAFITTLGKDTVAVEQFVRTGNILTGDYVTRQGGVVINHYVLSFDANNAPNVLNLTQQRADGSPIPNGPKSVTMTVGDKETTIVIQKEPVITRKFASTHPYPLLGTSLGMFEVAFGYLREIKGDSVAFQPLPLNAPELPNPIQVKFIGADSARLWTANGPLYFRVNRAGEIQGVSGRDTDTKIESRRLPSIDLKKIIAAFAASPGQ